MTSARQPGDPSDARERVVDIYDAKTREVPRPLPNPGPLPKPWRALSMRAGETTYTLPHPSGIAATLTVDGELLGVVAVDTRETRLRLVDLLGWMVRGGSTPSDGGHPAEPSDDAGLDKLTELERIDIMRRRLAAIVEVAQRIEADVQQLQALTSSENMPFALRETLNLAGRLSLEGLMIHTRCLAEHAWRVAWSAGQCARMTHGKNGEGLDSLVEQSKAPAA